MQTSQTIWFGINLGFFLERNKATSLPDVYPYNNNPLSLGRTIWKNDHIFSPSALFFKLIKMGCTRIWGMIQKDYRLK